jgi:hypothetical protein
MSVACVSVRVSEDSGLSAHWHALRAGGLDVWVYFGEGQDVSLWGSPAALRRLAAFLVVAAEEADERSPRGAEADLCDGALLQSCRAVKPGVRVVAGS